MMNKIKTILRESEATTEIKKSVFISYARPVFTKEEADNFISGICAKNKTATHNVFAYTLYDGQITKASDAGEPKGTAGLPVLGAIKLSKKDNVCVVVTRYFGGILLGASGLTRAYSKSASLAIESAGNGIIKQQSLSSLRCSYQTYNKLEHSPIFNDIRIISTDFGADISLEISYPSEDHDLICKQLIDISGNRIKINKKSDELKLIADKEQ